MKHQKTINSKFKLKKYYTGTNGINKYDEQDTLSEYNNLQSGSEGAKNAGQTVANGVGTAIPIVGAFKGIGEAGSKMFRQDDEYGISKNGSVGVAAGSVLNPLEQTTDLVQGKGGAMGMIKNALIIPGALDKEKERKQAKDIAENINKLKTKALNEQSTDVDQIGYAEKGLDLTGGKYKQKKSSNKIKDDIGYLGQDDENYGIPSYNYNISKSLERKYEQEKQKIQNDIMKEEGISIDEYIKKYPTQNDYDLKNIKKPIKNLIEASKGLDLTKYKKYGDGTTSIKTKKEIKPNYTPDEVQLLNKYKPLSEERKLAEQTILGYKPELGRGLIAEKNQQNYENLVNKFNARDVSKPYTYDLSKIDNMVAKKDIDSNINRINKNLLLDKYVNNNGGETADSNYTTIMNNNKPKQQPKYKFSEPTSMIYKTGTKGIKPVEVEGDEILMAKDKGKFKLKQDFKDGPTHEQGGIPIVAEEGDVIYPANKRNQVVDAIEDNNHKKLESIRKTLPSDNTKYKKADGDNSVGLNYKKRYGYKPNTSKLGISASDYAERPPNVISSFDNYKSEKLDLGGDGAGNGTTPDILQTRGYKMNAIEPIMSKSSLSSPTALKSPGAMTKIADNPNLGKSTGSSKFGNILSTAGEIAPIAYNIARGFEKPEKTVRRNYNPELLSYSDVSDPARNQAKNMYNDETNSIRNATAGNAGAYLANQGVSKSRQYERMNEINNNEATRKMDITAKNIDLKNNAQLTNIQANNQYDDLDLKNKAMRDNMMATGLTGLSDYSQKKTKAANEEKSDNTKINMVGQMYKDYELDTNEDGTPKYDKNGVPKMIPKGYKKRMGTKSINTKYKMKC